MLKIRALKIEVNTADGLFGATHTFDSGLNIIRGDNTSGKSSLFQSIIYGLGFEELLGGKNEKTMQSALKDQVEYPKNNFHQILQSYIYLEIENREIVTIKRSVISINRKPQLVDVYSGPLVTGDKVELPSRPMYVHDKGGASDDLYGFHSYLAEFLDWNLPEVINSKGDYTKLYLQQLAPAFLIEQKSGWSDFYATLPNYGMRNTESRIVEFILKLDVFENEKRKQKLLSDKQHTTVLWHSLYNQFFKLAEKSGSKLKGLDSNPNIINNFNSIYLAVIRDDKEISLNDATDILKKELVELEAIQTPTVGANITENERRLNVLNDKLSQISLNYEMLSPEINFDKEKLKQYNQQLIAVSEDLRKNKGALKVKSLGHSLPAETAEESCPTCHQHIKDSLLPIEIKQTTMRIEDNVAFLEAQQKMIEVYADGQRTTINDKEKKLLVYQNELTELRQEIRLIKKELTQDERLPSILEIEKRLNLQKKIEFYGKVIEEFAFLIEDLKHLSTRFNKILADQKKLPDDFFSKEDRSKIDFLYSSFINLLNKFNYQSKPSDSIRISTDNYLPVAEKQLENGMKLNYNIKFDSSASDFIRCLWAYYTALLKTSAKFQTSHPMLLLLDEPKQQDLSLINFNSFLIELSKFKQEQILVFASFENSDEAFEEATKGVEFALNRIEGKLIKPIKS